MKFIVTVQQSSLLCLTCIYIKCRPPRLHTGRHLCLSNGFEKSKIKESQNVNSFMYIFYDCTSIFIFILKGEPKTGKGFST